MKCLIISLLAFTFTDLCAQDSVEVELFKLENEVFTSTNDSLKNSLYLKKFALTRERNDYDRAYFELRRVREKYISDSISKSNFYWNAALTSKVSGNYQYANIYYDAYFNYTHDSSTATLLLGLLIKADTDTAEYNAFAPIAKKDSVLQCTDCLIELIEYKLKYKSAYIWASRIVPGLGTIMTGDVYNGLGSLVTLGGSGIGVYALIVHELYVGASVWGFMTLPRFYNGQIRLTRTKVNELEKKKRAKKSAICMDAIKVVLSDFPLNFK